MLTSAFQKKTWYLLSNIFFYLHQIVIQKGFLKLQLELELITFKNHVMKT